MYRSTCRRASCLLSCRPAFDRKGSVMAANSMFDLSGRVALVSGAAQGMGRAMSLALAEAGADLLLLDVNAAGAEETAGHITALGRRALAAACDVSLPEQIRAAFAVLDREYGRIDFLG